MPFQVADRVKESSTTTGTGAITLAGALTGFRAFSSVCSVGDICYYALQQVDANGNPSGVWETGIGTYSAASTLTRTTVLSSSNSNAAVTLAGTTHVWIDAPAAAQAALADRNVVIDGNFDSWQTGTSFSVTPSAEIYTADMWLAYAGTGGAATVSQLTIAPETPPAWVTTPRKYKLRFAQTTAASSAPNLMHRIEGVRRFSGRSITVSASLVAAAAATLVTTVQVAQNFGSGGSPSSTVYTNAPVTWNVGTTEARFSVRVDVPSIAGKTIGTNGDDQLVVAFILATGVTFTLDFSQVQIEESSPSSSGNTTGSGGAPTPFEYRGLSLELQRITRYMWVLGQGNTGTNPWDGVTLTPLHVVGSSSSGDVRGDLVGPGALRGLPAVSIVAGALYVGSGATFVAMPSMGCNAINGIRARLTFASVNTTGWAAGTMIFLSLLNSGTGGTLLFDARL